MALDPRVNRLHELEAEVNSLKTRNAELSATNEGLQTQQSSGSRQHGPPSRRADPVADGEDGDYTPTGDLRPTKGILSRLRDLGQAFIYTFLFLVDEDTDSPTNTFKQPLPEGYNPSLEEQFRNLQSISLMQTQRLTEVLGPDLAPHRSKEWVEAEFMHKYHNQRSTIHYRLRTEARSHILGNSAPYLDTPASRAEFKHWIGWTEHVIKDNVDIGPGFSPIDSPCLHKGYKMMSSADGRQVFNPSTGFMSAELKLVYAALLLGPSSIVSWQNNEPLPKTLRMLRILKCRYTTPEHLSLVSTLLRWMCSEDVDLVAGTEQSKHNWLLAFCEYYKYFRIGLRDKIPDVMRVFKEWDADFYPRSLANGYGHGAAADEDMPWIGDSLGDALARARNGEGEELEEGMDEHKDESDAGEDEHTHDKPPSAPACAQPASSRHNTPTPSPTPHPSSSTRQSREPPPGGPLRIIAQGDSQQATSKRRRTPTDDGGTEGPIQKRAKEMAKDQAAHNGGDDDGREVDQQDSD